MSFITLERVRKTFGEPGKKATETVILDDISLSLGKGEFVCLLGPSGCGKSTLMNLLAGFLKPDGGTLLLEGEPVTGAGPDRTVVFQQPQLFPWLSVMENVTFGLRMKGQNAEACRTQALFYLDQVGLSSFRDHAVWELSGGMKQRVALARAWVLKSRIFLMDEPFAALDAQTRLLMQELLTRLWMENRTTVLFVTHDVEEALLLADRLLVMTARPGQIRDDIRVDFERPRLIEDLLGDPTFTSLKRRVLHAVREEATRAMML